MAVTLFNNAKLYVGAWNLSADHNKIAVSYAADPKEVTGFGDTTHKYIGGLKSSGLAASGYWNAAPSGASSDLVYSVNVGSTGLVTTIAPLTGADGETAYFANMQYSSYSFGGQVGDVFPMSVDAGVPGPLLRGTVMHNSTRTSSGAGTVRQLGAISSSQRLYAALHVFSASGTAPTLDIAVASDDNGAFSSSTPRIFFSTATAPTYGYQTLDGPITDSYWQIQWTIGGTSPSFEFVVVVGIL